MRKGIFLESCFFFNVQQKFYIRSKTLLPVHYNCRIWMDFTSKNEWIWSRKKRVIIINSPTKRFRERFQY